MLTRRDFIQKSLVAGAAIGAGITPSIAKDSSASGRNARKKAIAHRVLILTFDGIRPDGLQQASTPNIDALISEGAASMTTRDVMPSVTLPNYTSILTGSGPEVHGVVSNDWLVDKYKIPAIEMDPEGYYPSVFSVLKQNVKDIRTGFFWNWKPLINPYNPSVFDETLYAEQDDYKTLYDKAFDFMVGNASSPQMIFLYTVHTDHTGHKYSWMSPEYIKSIEDGDKAIGELTAKMKQAGIYDGTHIFFISDHGGINKGHGGVSTEEMTVPWIIKGKGIRKGFTITEPNNTVNTASTILRLFGVEQPLCWTGEVPMSIFE